MLNRLTTATLPDEKVDRGYVAAMVGDRYLRLGQGILQPAPEQGISL
ncbi:hypothetical protein [Anaerotruncus rubiinfantis]|nr:hypothetical protein [Anaerotruncus rubiinfantis]